MSGYPEAWLEVSFDDICLDAEQVTPDCERSFKYIDISSIDRVSKKITNPQDLLGIDAPSRARKLVRRGDTLVSMTRPNLNAVTTVSAEFDGAIASTGFEVLRPNGVDERWISYLVRTTRFIDAMNRLVQGALYPAVRPKDVRAFNVPLAPLAEQKRIADKLDEVFARVEACRDRLTRVVPMLRRFRQAILAAATCGQLTEDWRDEHGRAIGELEGYLPRPLSYLLSKSRTGLRTGPFGSLLAKSDHRDDGIEVVGIENIKDGKFSQGSKIRIDRLKADALSAYDLIFGDVVISRSGTVGEICAIPAAAGELRFSTNIIRVSLDSEIILPEYFVTLFRGCPAVLQQVRYLCKGSTRAFLNQAILKEIEYPVPSVEEQKEVLKRIESLFAFADRLELRLRVAQNTIEQLIPATLAKAFRGELVQQDPNDEPPTELLERITLSCAVTANRSRRRRRAPQPGQVY